MPDGASGSRGSDAELQALLDASPDAVLVVDRTGTIVAHNRRLELLFGCRPEDLTGRSVDRLVPERLRRTHAAARAAYSASPTVRAMSARSGLTGLRADGTEFPVEISLSPVVGSPEGLVMAVVHEGSARARLSEALGETARAARALDAIGDAVLTTDARGRVVLLNRAAERLTGWAREAARGRPLSELLPVEPEAGQPRLQDVVLGCIADRHPGEPYEAVLGPAGSREARTLDISSAPVRDRAGGIVGTALVVRDVTHARLLARQLSHQATHDALTGLVNRTEFERRLARAVAAAAAEHAEHALCFLDLDGFKLVNDSCGHLAGDELLRQLSDLMRERMRSRDTLARLGGDEFGVLLEHCRLATAARIAEEIRSAVETYRFTANDQTYAVGVSIGIVPIRGTGDQPGELLRAADSACYEAKRCGGNRIQVNDPRRRGARAARARDWPRRVRLALEQDRFRLHAQPLVPLGAADGGAPRLELLLRLDEGRGEPLLPASFLPAAQRHGLMAAVDRWVVRQALLGLGAWRHANPGAELPTVAINLAGESVVSGELPALVRELVARSGVGSRALCFEITEEVAAAHPAASLRLLRELRAAGCRTTLEHCGSGMAAFTLLRRLPVDYLKIAGHLVRGGARDPLDRALATALNEAGHALRLGTVGVGVETAEALAFLRRLGVDFAQGFRVGRPEPFEAALARLARPPA